MTQHRALERALGAVLLAAMAMRPAAAQPPEPTAADPPRADLHTPTAVTAASAPVIIHEIVRIIRLESDGRHSETMRARVTVREQSALPGWGQLAFGYLSAYETMALRRLVVEKRDGTRVEADLARLEDAPTPQSGMFDAPAYNDTRMKQITVPSLVVGDTIVYEAVKSRHTPFLVGQFWDEHNFQQDVIVEREVFELDHPEQMSVAVRVRGDVTPASTDVREAGRRRRTWTHTVHEVREPSGAEAVARLGRALRGQAAPPDLQLSTFQTWDQVASWYATLSGPAEQATETLRARARALRGSDAAGTLAALHAAVSRDVRYVSLAFGEGRYKPRPAELTLSSAYGDCKDKHALLAALGGELGFGVRPVLINSSRALDPDFPSPGQFDHVISLLTTPDGRQIWVDATLDVGRPGTLFRPLRGKQGLLVTPAGAAEIVRTPDVLAQRIKIDITGSYEADGRYQVAVRRELSGDAEMTMRSVLKNVPQHGRLELGKHMAKDDGIGEAVTIKDVTLSDPMDLREPQWIRYEVEHRYGGPLRRERWTYWLPAPQIVKLPEVEEGAPLELGPAVDIELTARFVFPPVLAVAPPVGVSVEDEAARYESSYAVEGGVLTVRRRFTTRVERVEHARSAGLRALEKAARADRNQEFAVAAAPAEALTAATDRAGAGDEALRRGEVAEAITHLQAAVADEPDHARAWNSLGRALHAASRWDEAVAAYDRQIALNRFDEHAYRNRGLAQWGAGRLKQAEASMRAQIGVTPLNAAAFLSLGSILIDDKREAEAIEPLRKAVSLADSDGWAHLALARALAATGASDEALASFERVVTLAPNPTMWNNVAWWMSEYSLSLDKALDYARQAVAGAGAALAAASIDQPGRMLVGQTSSLAAYWDTLGWIEFKRGRVEEGLRFVRASWQVRQEPEVGEHLGRILEQLGRRREAFVAYRTAMGLPRAKDSIGRRAGDLAALTPPPPTADSASLGLEARTVTLKAIAPVPKPVEVLILAGAGGVIRAAKALGTAVALPQLVGVRLRVDAPDAAPFKLAMLAIFSCVDGRAPCSLLVYRPDQAIARLAGNTGARPE